MGYDCEIMIETKFMDIQTILKNLAAAKVTDKEIVKALKADGYSISPPTISRLRNSVHRHTKYATHVRIKGLYDEVLKYGRIIDAEDRQKQW
jgi:hypothetical protein